MTNLGLALNNSKGTLEVGAAEVHGKGASGMRFLMKLCGKKKNKH